MHTSRRHGHLNSPLALQVAVLHSGSARGCSLTGAGGPPRALAAAAVPILCFFCHLQYCHTLARRMTHVIRSHTYPLVPLPPVTFPTAPFLRSQEPGSPLVLPDDRRLPLLPARACPVPRVGSPDPHCRHAVSVHLCAREQQESVGRVAPAVHARVLPG
jgi:hypothetical protein